MHIHTDNSFQGCDTESRPELVCNGDRAQVSKSPDVVGMQNENQPNMFFFSLKGLIGMWFYDIKQKSAKTLTD